MNYMLLICIDDLALSETKQEERYAKSVQPAHQLELCGQYLAADPSRPPSRATGGRVRDSKALVTDGPFAETREHLGG